METLPKNNFDKINEIESNVFKVIEKIFSESIGVSSVEITKKIKISISDIGLSKGYKSYSSFNDREWLYDLVWYKNNERGYLEDVTLVLESEISRRSHDEIKKDFEKLLISNAKHRVMICMSEGNKDYPDNTNRMIDLFENLVNSCNNLSSGSRILTLIWEDYHTGTVFPHLIIKK